MKQSVWLGMSVVLLVAWLFIMSQPMAQTITGFQLLFGTWKGWIGETQTGIRGLSFVMLAAVVATAIAGIRKRD